MTKASKEPSKQVKQLVEQVRRAAKSFHYVPGKRGELNRLSRDLDAQGINPLDGGAWILEREGHGPSAQRLSGFLKKHVPILCSASPDLQEPVSPRSTQEELGPPNVTQGTAEESPEVGPEPSVPLGNTLSSGEGA
jgi:hypothetical protein